MKLQTCGACGTTLISGRYRGLDGTQWCQRCARAAEDEVRENYAQEVEVGSVDLHAVVLDLLTSRQQGELW